MLFECEAVVPLLFFSPLNFVRMLVFWMVIAVVLVMGPFGLIFYLVTENRSLAFIPLHDGSHSVAPAHPEAADEDDDDQDGGGLPIPEDDPLLDLPPGVFVLPPQVPDPSRQPQEPVLA